MDWYIRRIECDGQENGGNKKYKVPSISNNVVSALCVTP